MIQNVWGDRCSVQHTAVKIFLPWGFAVSTATKIQQKKKMWVTVLSILGTTPWNLAALPKCAMPSLNQLHLYPGNFSEGIRNDAFVTSRFNYRNITQWAARATFEGALKSTSNSAQKVHGSRMLLPDAQDRDHVIFLPIDLHWLMIHFPARFKIQLYVYVYIHIWYDHHIQYAHFRDHPLLIWICLHVQIFSRALPHFLKNDSWQ